MSHGTLSPEARLVFRTADPTLDPAECEAIAASISDWPRAFAIAEREVATLALWRAVQGTRISPPPNVERVLRQSALQTDLRMQQLAKRLRRSTEVLAERGIRSLLLKGAAVGALSDPTFRGRPMTDLDILVRREDSLRAAEAVIAAGWTETPDPVNRELLRDAHHLPHFVDAAQPGIRLELHVALLPDDSPFAFSESTMWEHARSAAPAFAGTAVPTPEHLLLHSCVHFAWQHSLVFGAWRTIRAVEVITSRPDFDWNGFSALAKGARAATACYWTLRLARTLAGLRVPDQSLKDLAPPTPEVVLRALERHFVAEIAPGEGPTSPSVKLSRLLWRAALRPRWSGHANPGRYDPQNRWARAYGVASAETWPQRIARHAGNIGEWFRFFSGTLFR